MMRFMWGWMLSDAAFVGAAAGCDLLTIKRSQPSAAPTKSNHVNADMNRIMSPELQVAVDQAFMLVIVDAGNP